MEEFQIDLIEMNDSAVVSIRWIRPTHEYARSTYCPGDDISSLPADVQEQINNHWTPERVAAWQAMKEQADG